MYSEPIEFLIHTKISLKDVFQKAFFNKIFFKFLLIKIIKNYKKN